MTANHQDANATLDKHAPCMAACPVHTDTRLFVEHIVLGRYEAALDLLLEANPFSSVCGRICHHPCEQECRRNRVEAPVMLRTLKRFIVESTEEYRKARRKPVERTRDKRVAIVGSGPAGLTAAHDLARQGFAVTVYERSVTPGGMLGMAIPRYRLPYEVLREDVDDVLALGVELVSGCEIGSDVTLEDLKKRGFDAVILATGLSESRTLAIQGIDSKGVLLAMPFLRTVTSGRPAALGARVVVIGGGNVAFDVARSARRLGSKKVTLVSLESGEEMPAWEWEIREAREEQIEILSSWGPRSVFSDNGVVRGIELKRCTRVFDDVGRFSPSFDEGDVSTLPADTLIIAIGQRPDLSCLKGSALEAEPGQRFQYDIETLATAEKGVFICGEVATGPGAAVEAVAEGHRVAQAVAHFLETGELIKIPVREIPAIGELPEEIAEKIKHLVPAEVPVEAPERRVEDFSEIEGRITEAEALREAHRCLACTVGAIVEEERCAGCLTCVRICPFGVATVEKTAVMPTDKCLACGLCAAECPAAAVALKRFGTNRMKEEVRALLANTPTRAQAEPLIVSFCCLFETTSRKFLREQSDFVADGVVRVMVPCVARLSVTDLLSPFELGADGVVVIACSVGDCLYPTAEERLRARVRKTKGILDEIKVGGERIDLWHTQGAAETSWTAFWELSKRKLRHPNAPGGRTDDCC